MACQSRIFSLLLLATSLVLVGCGYKFGRGDFVANYNTITVPFAQGDFEGKLTTEVIRQISIQGALRYDSDCADLTLAICLFDPIDDNIGFVYSLDESGLPTRVLAANEARLTVTAKVTVIDNDTGQVIVGPLHISSSITYDFDPDYARFNEHEFSLGQLETHNLAEDAAMPYLYKELAQKIVDTVIHSW